MNIPFADLFAKAKERLFPSKAPEATVVPRRTVAEKRTGERFSKTVMPNSTRTLTPPDPFKVASGSSKMRGMSSVALELEPKAERSISLQLADFLDRVPGGFVKPADSFDVTQSILLRASEVEKGMASGQPTISLATIYDQVPDIFLQNVAPGDATQVPLPYDKVLQQFESVQLRSDQLLEQGVPQVETPFLQVTIEDNERFGTTMMPVQTSAHPPVKVEPATARTLSTAEPEPVMKSVTPSISGRRGSAVPPKSPIPNQTVQPSPAPTRIPFHLPPNGAGEPASERVPASSGPPVPPSPPSAKPASASRIPFKIAAPCADLRPKFTLVPGVDPEDAVAAPPIAEKKDDPKMRLALNVVMRNVPAFQTKGTLPEIPADVRIELPCSLIEPQLASGRIAIDPKIFHAAIPETYRELFVVDATETPVLLPLQEVLMNLPATTLRMRADQDKEDAVDYFETPFSLHAELDEQRFRSGATDPAKPAESPIEPSVEPASETKQTESSAKPENVPGKTSEPEKSVEIPPEKKVEPAKEEKNEAKEFVTRASALHGVAACSITFADGLSLAGNLPAEIAADGLCAMAPSLLQKIEKHMLDTKLGPFTAMTLHCAKSPLTFFMQGNVCLTVLHADRQLETDTQEKLVEIVKELSQVYAQPETPHVDH